MLPVEQQVTQTLKSHPPDVLEVRSAMCQAVQPESPQPIARWILEEGQLLGVLVASFPAPGLWKTSACG